MARKSKAQLKYEKRVQQEKVANKCIIDAIYTAAEQYKMSPDQVVKQMKAVGRLSECNNTLGILLDWKEEDSFHNLIDYLMGKDITDENRTL